MRFLMLNWRDPRNPLAGGAERVTETYLHGLQARGHEVHWFTHHFAGAPYQEIADGIPVIRAGNAFSAPFHAWRWYRRQAPFDLVIDQHHGVPWYAPWWARARCVAYLHEVLGPIWDSFYNWPYNVIGRTQERWNYRLYRNVPFWTGSPSTAKALRERGVRDVTVLPYGIETEALPELEAKPLKPPLRLVMVSRLAPNKRIDHGIRTLAALTQRGIKAHLHIVGEGQADPALRRLVSQLGLDDECHFTGRLSEEAKNDEVRQAHWLLHTSLREGWGLNVIEANAMGTPAAVYPVCGLVDSTRHRETGLVARSETPEALAEALESLLAAPDLYEDLRRHAWQWAKALHIREVVPKACDWLEAQAAARSNPT